MEINYVRWTRFGHDRLYVNLGNEKIGWRNLKTNEDKEVNEQHKHTYQIAVENWLKNTKSNPSPEPQTVPEIKAKQSIKAIPEFDLASNKAGGVNIEKANSLKQRMKLGELLASAFTDTANDLKKYQIAGEAEKLVAEQINKLIKKDPSWKVIHDIPYGDRGNKIDHLLIGRAGVFVIYTKSIPKANIKVFPKTVSINGANRQYIQYADSKATRASFALSQKLDYKITAFPLLVFVNAKTLEVSAQPKGAYVTYRNNLVEALQKFPTVTNAEQIAEIYDAARKSTTWR